MTDKDKEDVYCTLVMNDGYLPGAAVLAHSLRDAGATRKLACMIVQDGLQASAIEKLQSLYDYVIPIEQVGNPNPANLYLMNRPDLLYTFTKINLWRLIQFRKIVYIDSDVVALRAPEELFDLPDDFAAAPDVGWPDAFNTGVMVLSPSSGDYNALRGLANAGDSFDGADQGLLNQYFEYRPWKRLSFTYNTTPSANYQYEPAYRYYKRDISLVHFIGKDKPWTNGRSEQSMPNAFQELLSRWWAVWDRHFEISTSDYVFGQRKSTSIQGSAQPILTEKSDQTKHVFQDRAQPARTHQQRKFSAPQMAWDATRGAPPLETRPEAFNFPSQTYDFNTNKDLFRPPSSYPEPPKDMWYEVPAKPVEQDLKPIFPWEEREHRKPARKFLDEEQKPVEGSPLDTTLIDELEVSTETPDPGTPTIKVDDVPWQSYGRNKNAWDEMSGIETYVRQLTAFQKNRGNVQVVQTDVPASDIPQHILSPTNEPDPAQLVDRVRQRRESLILTDFPSATERPSLPVTPAPRRRPTFWGEERESESDLPPAEGVPSQADWDPSEQLEQLRRNSLIGPEDLKLPQPRKLSLRAMPGSAAPIPEQAQAHKGLSTFDGIVEGDEAPTFKEPGFGKAVALDEVEKKKLEDSNGEVLSPSQVQG